MSMSIDFVIENGRPRKRIRTVGGPDVQIHDLAPEDLASERYLRWMAGQPLATPVEELIGRAWVGNSRVSDTMIHEWKSLHADYVEDLAGILDSVPGFGMKAALRKLASDYLAEKATKAKIAQSARGGEASGVTARLDAIDAKLTKVLDLLEKGRDA